jgi:hypothetical protein
MESFENRTTLARTQQSHVMQREAQVPRLTLFSSWILFLSSENLVAETKISPLRSETAFQIVQIT